MTQVANTMIMDAFQHNQVFAHLANHQAEPTNRELFATRASTKTHSKRRTTIVRKLLKSTTRIFHAINPNRPPSYSREAWPPINYPQHNLPPSPPYPGHDQLPSYENSIQLGIVAAPAGTEEGCHGRTITRVSTLIRLTLEYERQMREMLQRVAEDPDTNSPLGGEEEYLQIQHTAGKSRYTSNVVGQWRLGAAAVEKPPIHPLVYQCPAVRRAGVPGRLRSRRRNLIGSRPHPSTLSL